MRNVSDANARKEFIAEARRFDISRERAESAMLTAVADGMFLGEWYAVTYSDDKWSLYLY
jgi:hypothetical protein